MRLISVACLTTLAVACSNQATSVRTRSPASAIRVAPELRVVDNWKPGAAEIRLTAELERRIGHPAPDLIALLRPVTGGSRYIRADDPTLQCIIDSIYAQRGVPARTP
jgi:hypothetical protein